MASQPTLPIGPLPVLPGSAEFSQRQENENRLRRLDLKLVSPLQGKCDQHDESDLASADEPGLPL